MSSDLHTNYGFAPTFHGQTTATQTTQTGTTQTVQTKTPYDGVDSTSQFDGTLHFGDKKTPNGDAKFPVLPFPNEKGVLDPAPLRSAGQNVVRDTYTNNVVAQLKQQGASQEDTDKILKYLTNPNPQPILGADGKVDLTLMKLAQTVDGLATTATQKECGLPDTWSMKATDASSWTPLPVKPYTPDEQKKVNEFFDKAVQEGGEKIIESALKQSPPLLTEAQAGLLRAALKTGTPDPSISSQFYAIQETATQITQTQFNLPRDWFRGTENIQNWTPTGTGPLTPANIQLKQIANTADNAEATIKMITNAVQAKLDKMAPNDPARANLTSILDFMKMITSVLGDAKKLLQQMQIGDAERTQKASQAKWDTLAARKDAAAASMKKMEEAAAKQKSMSDLGLSMKIIGPIVSALVGVACAVAGAIIAVCTLGAGTAAFIALLVIGITLTAGMTAFSVVDSECHITEKAVGVFNQVFDAIMPGAPEWAKWVVKALVIGVCAAELVLVLVALLLSGSGVSTIANVSVKVVVEAVRQALTQILLAVLMAVVSSTNCIPKLVTSIMKANGASASDCMITEAVLSGITMGVLAIFGMFVSSKDFGTSIQKGVENAAKSASKGISGILKDSAAAVAKSIEKSLKYVQKFSNSDQKCKMMGEALMTMMPFYEEDSRWEKMSSTVTVGAELVQGTVQLVNSSVQLGISIKMYHLAMEKGDLKAAEEFLKGMITMLEKMLKDIQGELSGVSDMMQEMGSELQKIMSSLNKSMMDMAGAALQGAA